MKKIKKNRIESQSKNYFFFLSLIPLVFLIATLGLCIYIFQDDTTNGPSQIVLILAGFLAAFLAIAIGVEWKIIENHIIKGVANVAQAIFILLLIGSLIGIWILAGIIPTLISYGLQFLHPDIFLVVAVLICAASSLTTGSSWSTAGTFGVILIGIATTAGISPAMTAGAVICGSYFGDKLSPFSETTNLAASITDVDLITHIKHMLYTTIPGLVLSLVFFAILGQTLSTKNYNAEQIDIVLVGLESNFNLSFWVTIPLFILLFLAIKRVPAIIAIFIGIILGVICAAIFQPQVIQKFAGDQSNGNYLYAVFKANMIASVSGFKSNTGLANLDNFLSKGGMTGMLNTVWLILTAMFFSGVMEGSGMLKRITNSILKHAYTRFRLFATTIFSTIFVNFTASDQYLSIVLNGRMYNKAFQDQQLAPKNLSRVLEDSGTLTSPLVPWNTCGAFMATTLGVATIDYLPYCVLNYSVPVISLLYALTNFTIEKRNS